MTATPFDIAIIGAGPVGLALAHWLVRSGPWQVALIDARTPVAAAQDPRALALSQGSRLLLEELGAWPQAALPIRTIHVSQRGFFGQSVMRHDELGQPALGYVARYGDLVATLAQALDKARSPRLLWLTDTRVNGIAGHGEQGGNGEGSVATASGNAAGSIADDAAASAGAGARAATTGSDGPPLRIHVEHLGGEGRRGILEARYVVNAEGGVFGAQAGKARQRDYDQVALISTVECDAPRPDWAWERFTAEGPLALLPHPPLPGSRQPVAWSLVWCGSPEATQARMQLDDPALLAELQQAFGRRMGRFTAVGARFSFPLGLNAASELVEGRMVAIGNAAQTLHPVAGQGFNLGLRDAFTLAAAVREELSEAKLAAFAAARRADRGATIGLTDALPRLFAGDTGPLPHLRGAALAALDLLPPLKGVLARQMMFGQRRQA